MWFNFLHHAVAQLIDYGPDHWVVESPEIGDMWHEHIYKGKQPDNRLKHHPFHHLIPAKLKLVVGPDMSTMVRDKKTNELVLAVI
jgi:hypothetical protein